MRTTTLKGSASKRTQHGKRPAAVRKGLSEHPRTKQRAAFKREVESETHAPVAPGAAFDPDLRHRMISEAAYYLYTERGCADGYDIDDWLQAETQVDDLIMNPEHEDEMEVSAPLASP
jgi:hypothetical protein